jgi:hypothetical protein
MPRSEPVSMTSTRHRSLPEYQARIRVLPLSSEATWPSLGSSGSPSVPTLSA